MDMIATTFDIACSVRGMETAFRGSHGRFGARISEHRCPAGSSAERGRGASSRQAERLANDVPTTKRFLGQRPIGLQDQTNSVDEIRAGFLQCVSLGVGARKLLDEGSSAPM